MNLFPFSFLTAALGMAGAGLAEGAAPRADRAASLPEWMAPSREEVYKRVGDAELRLFLFLPPNHSPEDRRAAIVLFFGGGWAAGSPRQFFPQAAYLASRGMVAVSAEYRVGSRHGVRPDACVTDAKSAMRWVRQHAGELGIAPDRIAAGGGSAGGHLAACAATVAELDDPTEDRTVRSRPDALVLFNPALVLDETSLDPASPRAEIRRQRFGDLDPKRVSPFHHLRADLPPTLILHGEQDTTVPIESVRRFAAAAARLGARCEVVAYPGAGHGFFNHGRGKRFADTLRDADRFLVSIGYLEGPDTVDTFGVRE